MDDEVLTVPEAGARFLRMKPSTVYDKCAKRELPHIRLPGGKRRGAIRFTRRMLEDFLRKNVVQPKVKS